MLHYGQTPVRKPKEVLAKIPMILCESEPGNIKIQNHKQLFFIQYLKMINYWLAKQEPSGPRGYNFEQLKKEKSTVWDGVHNNLALKHMQKMKPGDLVLFYHTGDERQAVGIMQVSSKPYPNPKEDNERFIVVDVKYKKTLKRPVTLDEIKQEKKFQDWELVRISRLSVMPVPKSIWDAILKISQN